MFHAKNDLPLAAEEKKKETKAEVLEAFKPNKMSLVEAKWEEETMAKL